MGKVSVDWLRIYGMMTSKTDRDETDEELWRRKVVEYTVRHIMELWESRNKDVHGETNTSPVRRARLQEEIRSLELLREKVRLVDSFLFIHDVEEYLKTATVHTMTVYLSNTKKSILRSVKLWEKNKDAGEGSILTWIRHVPGNEAFVKIGRAHV